ncbi:unnamed protein product [Urochloa decumbens]|uniref:Uncharacterized protein n=1 Tax=Urochloa decumbens TaxID=240449 RepID=A0ABC8XIM1_9POAL
MDLVDDEVPPPPPRAAMRSRPSSWSSSGSSGGVEYTSLRDVISEAGGPGSGGGSFGGDGAVPGIDFDINIRNHLLKHAASAYLQSAIVVPPRDRGCLSRLWRRLLHRRRCRILLRPWPELCGGAGDPPRLCAANVAGSARRLVAFISVCVARMCT